jgi:hypothetical protein
VAEFGAIDFIGIEMNRTGAVAIPHMHVAIRRDAARGNFAPCTELLQPYLRCGSERAHAQIKTVNVISEHRPLQRQWLGIDQRDAPLTAAERSGECAAREPRADNGDIETLCDHHRLPK